MTLAPDSASAESLLDRVEFFAGYSHTSDILRTRHDGEPTNDFLHMGLTVAFRKFDIDLSHGMQTLDCGQFITGKNCEWETGSRLTVRWYPFRWR